MSCGAVIAKFAALGRSARYGIVGSVDHWIEGAAARYYCCLNLGVVVAGCNKGFWLISRNWFKLGAFGVWFLCLGSYYCLDRN